MFEKTFAIISLLFMVKPGDKVGPFVVVDVPGKSPAEIALHWPERKTCSSRMPWSAIRQGAIKSAT
jgi:hypothetical protein